MKKSWIILLALFLSVSLSFGQKQPKYIFYFIGDGMGLNQIHATELYLASENQNNAATPLIFSTFPFATYATSHSLSHGVTDSGAGGTALAVGYKTKNGVIGMDSAGIKSYQSIAYKAQQQGLKVGIATSVSIDHATPAAFYAHQKNRSMYYEIGKEIITSKFDFFAGAGFLKPETNAKGEKANSLIPQLESAGYIITYGMDDFNKKAKQGDKFILMNKKGSTPSALKYAIDQNADDMNLSEITRSAIQVLSKGEKGFFLMIEGGKIDWASHSNDGATVVKEVLDFNQSVQKAYDFYLKHPEETLIVVTADHETGGLGVGNGSSTLRIQNLSNQKISQEALSVKIGELRKEYPDASWDKVKSLIGENTGLWSTLKIDAKDEKELFVAYEKSFVNHQNETQKSLYANVDKIAALAIKVLNKSSSLSWASGGHSAAFIPVFAVGVGAENFSHKMDNIDIPRTVAKIAGWEFDD